MATFRVIGECIRCKLPIIEAKALDKEVYVTHCGCLFMMTGLEHGKKEPTAVVFKLDTNFIDFGMFGDGMTPIPEA